MLLIFIAVTFDVEIGIVEHIHAPALVVASFCAGVILSGDGVGSEVGEELDERGEVDAIQRNAVILVGRSFEVATQINPISHGGVEPLAYVRARWCGTGGVVSGGIEGGVEGGLVGFYFCVGRRFRLPGQFVACIAVREVVGQGGEVGGAIETEVLLSGFDALPPNHIPGIVQGYGHSRRGGGFFSYNNADGCSRAFVAEGTDSSVFEKAIDSAELDVTGVGFVFLQSGDGREWEGLAGERFAVDSSALQGELGIGTCRSTNEITITGGTLHLLRVGGGSDGALGEGVGVGSERSAKAAE